MNAFDGERSNVRVGKGSRGGDPEEVVPLKLGEDELSVTYEGLHVWSIVRSFDAYLYHEDPMPIRAV